ncbi:hypothetical protein QJS04_geneDACA008292 [Acorus gramineus]|uniref:Uncharacterized protein n=1 Tax=Acorus gramineus TaxID=55184 RepID=A0AAV9AXY7_ACOGR|nr:hypothetical protein QJS04_geneDACA008292 [Acorus gramineus]
MVVLQKEYLDLVLAPSGLLLMFGYHLFLLYRILKYPHKTVIGYENHNKNAWVERMLQTETDVGLAINVIASNASTSTYLASLSISLSSLIGTWAGNSNKNFLEEVILGDRSLSTYAIKYISILMCFLIAFTCFVQSVRYYVHASFLISTLDSDLPVKYVQRSVIRGGNFWSLGLRALYFATMFLLWIFGPIPMFTCSVSMVVVLHMLDTNSVPLHQFRFSSTKKRSEKVVTASHRILLGEPTSVL